MNIEKFANMINECNNIVFFGGAGISPETLLGIDFFKDCPDVFYDFYRKYFTSEAEPNKTHKALAELEEMGKLKAVISQNID